MSVAKTGRTKSRAELRTNSLLRLPEVSGFYTQRSSTNAYETSTIYRSPSKASTNSDSGLWRERTGRGIDCRVSPSHDIADASRLTTPCLKKGPDMRDDEGFGTRIAKTSIGMASVGNQMC